MPRPAVTGAENGPRRQTGVEAAGASLRCLPPHSPDFNPIEMASAKLKALLRAATRERYPTSGKPSPNPFAASPAKECTNCLAIAGYDAT
jgi:hypothetical protein